MFSAGANLEALMPVFAKSGAKGIAPELKKFQDFMLRVRYAQVPVISAIRGIALAVAASSPSIQSKRVAAMESYMGLVEVGVGLVPGAGGLTYIARRAAEMAAAAGNANADILKFVTDGFTNAAMAKVGTSAIESRKLGYLLWSDVIVPNKDELLFVRHAAGQGDVRRLLPRAAKAVIRSAAQRHRRPSRASSPTCGRRFHPARTTPHQR